ncbi:(2Fe-2S)-binding protein [Massilia antarctica]|uniref:(2Fe-2S)-binding protein n=1 Tax=Massilia antarctica TaxID=2765360 RepID=UPI0006BB83AF|nr:(2Fe-2S)-binding protein [Massilia sp. H27-R4]MCY0914281.1 (2Fe-2S)-binding protein [Massilia sp. H27-R4]CUI08694.1 Periplasmic aromatic aldehyde oxidoreductase, iron-sulfur subunit YagT [Janthinobacterium sp. CG23_2]CUU32480.1 Periplasmic aromatic aldehyde oxidoreductase, iron-sulfur subunit YagT [Janthinobacterium sp. CG23_2]
MDAHTTAGPTPAVATYPISLRINGEQRQCEVEAWVTLLDLLRERLGLTGTKKGCDHGQCGACTVLVGGKRINACLTLAVMQNGKDVVTVEGLADGGQLHPLQQAFIDHDAFQCGYCTPGQLCSAVGLMREGEARTVAEVRELMSGNVCRCGAYPQIVAAVTQVMGLAEHKDNPDRPYLPGTVPA